MRNQLTRPTPNTSFNVMPNADNRDHQINTSPAFQLTNQLPPVVSLKQYCSPVEDQGKLQSCTAHAITSALEYAHNRKANNNQAADLSRLFLYYYERQQDNNIWLDTGAKIITGLKILNKQGIPPETLWPYNPKSLTKEPSLEAQQAAKQNTITAYARVPQSADIQAIRQTLASGYPIITGFKIYQSFLTGSVKHTGIYNPNKEQEKRYGGHAVLMIGYDDSTRHVLLKNSYGTAWGQQGYFQIPYTFISDPANTFDLWALAQ